MDHLNNILERADLRQIRAFLLHGVEGLENEANSSAQRLREESQPIYARLEKLYSGEAALDEAIADLARALAAYEETYLELGVKVGARLARELLG